MKTFVNFAEMGVGDVGVNLGGGDVGVAEERLDGAKIGAIHEEVSGEAVAEGVGSDVLGDTGFTSILLDDAFDRAWGEAAVVAGGIGGLDVAGIIEEEGGERIGASVEIILDTVGGGLVNENGAVFVAFATDDKFATFEIDGIAIEAAEFGNTETTREEEFDDGAVAEAGLIGCAVVTGGGNFLEEAFDFVEVKEGDLFFGGARKVDEAGVEGIDATASEIFEEAAECDEMISLGQGGEVLLLVVVVEAVELEAEAAEELGGDVFGFEVAIFKVFAGEFKEAGEIEGVVVDGATGATFFDFEGFEEVGDEVRNIHKVIITFFTAGRGFLTKISKQSKFPKEIPL